MRTSQQIHWRYDPLDPRGIFVFLALVLLWCLWSLAPTIDAGWMRVTARWAGYFSFLAMLVPYWHILERAARTRPRWRMSIWLRLHILSAYLAFFFLLIHSQARAGSPLTLALSICTWVVMLSGVVGFYGQKLLYWMLPGMQMVPQELGTERLEPERLQLIEEAKELQESLGKIKGETPLPAVTQFVDTVLEKSLQPGFRLAHWLVRNVVLGRLFNRGLDENRYLHASLISKGKQQEIVNAAWQLAQQRWRLDHEYHLHQLGRAWLWVHGPASWLLFVLMAEHVIVSLWRGGY